MPFEDVPFTLQHCQDSYQFTMCGLQYFSGSWRAACRPHTSSRGSQLLKHQHAVVYDAQALARVPVWPMYRNVGCSANFVRFGCDKLAAEVPGVDVSVQRTLREQKQFLPCCGGRCNDPRLPAMPAAISARPKSTATAVMQLIWCRNFCYDHA